jgi:23S rRNA pseudouridine955/2504/2580 synthase/23S rRNA pseudouridine1911/1915/1917 synthase
MRQTGLQVLSETDEWVVVNKPSGLLTIPDRHNENLPSLHRILQTMYPGILVVHRIDRDTSGLVIFAKTPAAHALLCKQFEDRQVEKWYLAFLHGTPQEMEGSISAPMREHPAKNGTMVVHAKGREAISLYEVKQSFGKFSLVAFKILTGRTHQIRVHAKHIGHPVVCDPLYGNGLPIFLSQIKKKVHLSKAQEQETPLLGRLGLHAWQLHVTDAAGEMQSLEAPLPKDLKALYNQLAKNLG